jgi:type I restriction enzyme S subunit
MPPLDEQNLWPAQIRAINANFTDEQLQWLHHIAEHIATSLEIKTEDFDYVVQRARRPRPRLPDLRQQTASDLERAKRKVGAVSGVPKGWVEARFSDLCDVVQGQSPPGSTYNYDRRGAPFFQGKADFGSINPVPQVWCDSPTKIAESGDILISIRAPVGPTNVADQRCAIGRGLAAIRALGEIQPSFVLFAIRFREHELHSVSTGSTFAAISGRQLRALTVPLPPLLEQRRIVSEIEKQFTRLDAGSSQVKASKRKLAVYKRSVLTSITRTANSHGSTGAPTLPPLWTWSILRELLSRIEAGRSFRCEERPPLEDETGVLKVSAVSWGEFDEAESKHVRSRRESQTNS